MSIVRIGLGETKGFDSGYEAIFGKKKPTTVKKTRKTKGKSAGGKTRRKR